MISFVLFRYVHLFSPNLELVNVTGEIAVVIYTPVTLLTNRVHVSRFSG